MKTTLLLRFRDLSCPLNQTIERHQKLISSKGYVYWGWWNKGHEKLPSTTIEHLKLHEGNIDIFLFDSAQKVFYRAKCLGIHSNYGSPVKTPDEEHTPEYYKENTHPIWFKFNEIKEINSDSVIGNMTYEGMEDLFKSETHYDIYNNKIIASGDELAEQNRTIWKIRCKNDDDNSGEIRLKDMTEIQPSHFDLSYKTSRRDSLLWISDPHFTKLGHHEFSLDEEGSQADKSTLSRAIDNAYFSQKGSHDIASLLISGDLTWKGSEEEFDLASKFLEHICSIHSLDKSWLAFCPGNHDLSFYADDLNKLDTSSIQQNCESSKKAYSDFYAKFFDLKPNESMSSGRRFLLNNTIPVEIVMLNSVTLQQIADSFQGHGFIGEKQLTDVVEQMNLTENKPRNVTRICVMHHHLMPVSLSQEAYADAKYSTVLDAERLSRWLSKYNFDFLLHGHMHQNFHCCIERHELTHKRNNTKPNRLNVLSLGSSGVKVSHTGESHGNWCCKITFGEDKIRFNYGKLSPQDASLADSYELEFDYND